MERVHGRDIFPVWGIICKAHEKNCVAQEKEILQRQQLKGFKVFKEAQMIFHGEEVLNINLTCEKQTHDTALRMRVHNPDMLFKTSVLLRKAANTPIQTSV